MRIFLSWSGETSKFAAEALRDWLPNVIQSIEPWLSSEDIPIGASWFNEIQKRLETSTVGIVCLTRENLSANWLHFEAGALSKQGVRIAPYLLDLKPSEITGPLSQFQCVQATSEDTYRLVQYLNGSSKPPIPDSILKRAFELHWPRLQNRLDEIRRLIPRVEPKRTLDEKMDDALVLLREMASGGTLGTAREDRQNSSISERPRVFIGSSTEGLSIAEAIQLGLDAVAECTLWTQSTFQLGQAIIEGVVDASLSFDFAILVLTPDDSTDKRGKIAHSPRDNILFELGLFTGALGRARTFMVYSQDEQLHLPSDLNGVTAATFRKRSDGNIQAAIGPVCTRIKQAMGVF